MSGQPLIDAAIVVLAVVTLVLAISAIVAYAYVRWVVGDSVTRSRELRRLVFRDGRVALGGGVIAVVAAYTLLRLGLPLVHPEWQLPAAPPGWFSIAICVAVDLMLWGVIDDAITFRRLRSEGVLPQDDDR